MAAWIRVLVLAVAVQMALAVDLKHQMVCKEMAVRSMGLLTFKRTSETIPCAQYQSARPQLVYAGFSCPDGCRGIDPPKPLDFAMCVDDNRNDWICGGNVPSGFHIEATTIECDDTVNGVTFPSTCSLKYTLTYDPKREVDQITRDATDAWNDSARTGIVTVSIFSKYLPKHLALSERHPVTLNDQEREIAHDGIRVGILATAFLGGFAILLLIVGGCIHTGDCRYKRLYRAEREAKENQVPSVVAPPPPPPVQQPTIPTNPVAVPELTPEQRQAVITEYLQCPVCLDRPKNGALEECGHMFCDACIEKLEEQHPDELYVCPICTVLSDHWIDLFI